MANTMDISEPNHGLGRHKDAKKKPVEETAQRKAERALAFAEAERKAREIASKKEQTDPPIPQTYEELIKGDDQPQDQQPPCIQRVRKSFILHMAHQLTSAFSQECAQSIHGHSFKLELFFEREVDEGGMVLDFGFIREKITLFLMQWDHSLIMPMSMHPAYLQVMAQQNRRFNAVAFNPTAENLSKYFYQMLSTMVPHLVKVRLHETETGYAEYSPQNKG